jgi:LmbE family N-acetylglucosaminyl deacetylase
MNLLPSSNTCSRRAFFFVILALVILVAEDQTFSQEPKKLRFLVLAPHTDDAEYGLGGFLTRLSREGHEVIIVNMTGNNAARSQAARTKQLMGVQTVEWLDMKDGGVVETPESRAIVTACIDKHRPDIIFATWPVDEHPDHRATGALAIHCVNAKQQLFVDKTGVIHPEEYCPQLYFYEVISGKQSKVFRPDVYVDLPGDIVTIKKQVMEVYNTTGYMNSAQVHHMKMLTFRGLESGTSRQATIDKGVWAEALIAFPLATGQRRIQLPGEK